MMCKELLLLTVTLREIFPPVGTSRMGRLPLWMTVAPASVCKCSQPPTTCSFTPSLFIAALEAAVQQDVTLIIVLGILVPIILLLFVFAFRKYNRKDRHQGPLYEVAASGRSRDNWEIWIHRRIGAFFPDYLHDHLSFQPEYPTPFCAENSKKSFGPDLTQSVGGSSPPLPLCFDHACSDPNSVSSGHKSITGIGGSLFEEEQYSTPAAGRKDSIGGHETPASEHLYDLPLMRSPIDSPVPLETLHLLSPPQVPHQRPPQTTPTAEQGRSRWAESPPSSLEKSIRSASPSSGTSDATSGEFITREVPLAINNELRERGKEKMAKIYIFFLLFFKVFCACVHF